MNKAVEWQYLTNNPIRGLKKLRSPKKPPRFLSREEINQMLASAPRWLKALLVIGLNTGMRKQEILNLMWRHVDLQRRTIVVQSEGTFHTKNYDFRTISMNEALLNELIFL